MIRKTAPKVPRTITEDEMYLGKGKPDQDMTFEDYESDSQDYKQLLMGDRTTALKVKNTINQLQNIQQGQISLYLRGQKELKNIIPSLLFHTEDDPEPKQGELQDAQGALQSYISNRRIPEFIDKLYNWMMFKKSEERVKQQAKRLKQEQEKKMIVSYMRKSFPHIQNQPVNKCKIVYQKGQVVLSNRGLLQPKLSYQERYEMIRNKRDYLNLEREVGARAYCDRGYGIPHLRKQLQALDISLQVQDKHYKAVCTGFVVVAFKRMEKFLIDECKRKMKRINTEQLRVMLTVLFNCRDNFERDVSLTFQNFVRLEFGLGEVDITERQASKTYAYIMKGLHNKVKEQKYNPATGRFRPLKQSRVVSPTPRLNADSLWTEERRMDFYRAYLRQGTLNGVKEFFREKYDPTNQNNSKGTDPQGNKKHLNSNYIGVQFCPEYSVYRALTDHRNLTSMLQKTFRTGLRKIQAFASHRTGFPTMPRINDRVVKGMFSHYKAKDLRNILVGSQMREELDNETVLEAVQEILKFNDEMSNQIDATARSREKGLAYEDDE